MSDELLRDRLQEVAVALSELRGEWKATRLLEPGRVDRIEDRLLDLLGEGLPARVERVERQLERLEEILARLALAPPPPAFPAAMAAAIDPTPPADEPMARAAAPAPDPPTR